MVEQTGQRRPSILAEVAGKLTGVAAQQVMHAVPAGDVLGQQVRGGQLVQRVPGLVTVDGGETGRGRDADIRPRMRAQQTEHPGGRCGEGLVGPGKYRAQVRGASPRGEQVEAPTRVAQLRREQAERRTWVGDDAGCRDVQRQGQTSAEVDQLVHRRRFAGYPVWSQAPLQEFTGFVPGEQVHRQRDGAINSDQIGQQVAARDDDQAAGGAG